MSSYLRTIVSIFPSITATFRRGSSLIYLIKYPGIHNKFISCWKSSTTYHSNSCTDQETNTTGLWTWRLLLFFKKASLTTFNLLFFNMALSPVCIGSALLLAFRLQFVFSETKVQCVKPLFSKTSGDTPIKKGQDENVSITIYFLQYFIRG